VNVHTKRTRTRICGPGEGDRRNARAWGRRRLQGSANFWPAPLYDRCSLIQWRRNARRAHSPRRPGAQPQDITRRHPAECGTHLHQASRGRDVEASFDRSTRRCQRAYVESLSATRVSYCQMMEKPDVDSIDGLSPADLDRSRRTSRKPALDGRHSQRRYTTTIRDDLYEQALSPPMPRYVATHLGSRSNRSSSKLSRVPMGTRFTINARRARDRTPRLSSGDD